MENAERERRTIEGQIVNSQKQLRFTLIFVGGGVFVVGALSFYLFARIQREVTHLDWSHNVDPEIMYPILDNLSFAQVVVGWASSLIFLFAIWRAFRMSHRIWGPMVPFRRHVAELKKGNYSSRVHLRDGDEFPELMEDLNSLAESLEKAAIKRT